MGKEVSVPFDYLIPDKLRPVHRITQGEYDSLPDWFWGIFQDHSENRIFKCGYSIDPLNKWSQDLAGLRLPSITPDTGTEITFLSLAGFIRYAKQMNNVLSGLEPPKKTEKFKRNSWFGDRKHTKGSKSVFEYVEKIQKLGSKAFPGWRIEKMLYVLKMKSAILEAKEIEKKEITRKINRHGCRIIFDYKNIRSVLVNESSVCLFTEIDIRIYRTRDQYAAMSVRIFDDHYGVSVAFHDYCGCNNKFESSFDFMGNKIKRGRCSSRPTTFFKKAAVRH